jgi:lysyl-tRNA synthetase class 2
VGGDILAAMPSSVIRDFAYDADRNELTVNFVSGKVYVYSLVPPPIVAAFADAAAKGAYFNTHIRDRYPFRKERAEAAADEARVSLLEALRRSHDG